MPWLMVHSVTLAQSISAHEVKVSSDRISLPEQDLPNNVHEALVSFQTESIPPTGSNEVSLPSIEEIVINLAHPAGPGLDCQAIVNAVRCNRTLSQSLVQQLHASLQSYAHEHSSSECRCIVELIVERLIESQIKDALKAHVVIATTTSLANEQVVSLQRIEDLQQQQQVAIENGLSIRDPSAIDRLRLKVIDSIYQNRGLNQNARGQLAVITDTQVYCSYIALHQNCPCCDASDLCTAIQTAMTCRVDLQALRAIDQWLCKEHADATRCEAILRHSLFGSGIPLSGSPGHPLLNLLRGRNVQQERIDSLRSIAQASYSLLQDKVTAEVTDTWYRVQTNRDRLIVADLTRESSTRRLEQLQQIGKEVGVTADELIQADLQEREATFDVILRQQELHLSEIDLAFALGKL